MHNISVATRIMSRTSTIEKLSISLKKSIISYNKYKIKNFSLFNWLTILTHSTASFTSCVLKIFAPFMSEIVCNTEDPFNAFSGLYLRFYISWIFLKFLIMGL